MPLALQLPPPIMAMLTQAHDLAFVVTVGSLLYLCALVTSITGPNRLLTPSPNNDRDGVLALMTWPAFGVPGLMVLARCAGEQDSRRLPRVRPLTWCAVSMAASTLYYIHGCVTSNILSFVWPIRVFGCVLLLSQTLVCTLYIRARLDARLHH
jgi:hypothetical protein